MSQRLCTKCNSYFATQKTNFMCSVCYKEYLKIQSIKLEADKINIEKMQLPVPKQADHSRCHLCSKKVGLLGYKCKGCDCSYCKNHRIPEDHHCETNYQQLAKKEIEKNNPNITAAKIQKI